MVLRQIAFILLFSAALLAQAPATPTANGKNPPQAQTNATPAPSPGTRASAAGQYTQMLNDLSQMESLNLNMSSEIEFLRDQNLQILLRTNSRMWTILIRDLRQQIQLQQRSSTVERPVVPRATPQPPSK